MATEEMDSGEEKDPEAAIIVAKLRKQAGGGKVGDDEKAEDEDDASSETRRSAAEDVFQAVRGRAPTDEEASKIDEALQKYVEELLANNARRKGQNDVCNDAYPGQGPDRRR